MAILSTSSPSGAAIRSGRKTIAYVKADKAVKDLAPVLKTAQDDLKAHMNARVACDDANIDAQEESRAREDDLLDALGTLGVKAYGLFESYDAPGYRRILAIAPSKLAGMSEEDRRKEYAATFAALKEDTPKELAVPVKAAQAAHDDYETAYKGAAGTQAALDKSIKAEKQSLDGWHTAVRKLKAQITDRFPRDARRVARYFKSAVVAKKKTAAAPVAAVA